MFERRLSSAFLKGFLAASVLLLIGMRISSSLEADGETVQGTVKEVDVEPHPQGPVSYWGTIRYVTKSGEIQTAVMSVPPSTEPGDVLSVQYDRTNPDRIYPGELSPSAFLAIPIFLMAFMAIGYIASRVGGW